jgi:hypothetical protein
MCIAKRCASRRVDSKDLSLDKRAWLPLWVRAPRRRFHTRRFSVTLLSYYAVADRSGEPGRE